MKKISAVWITGLFIITAILNSAAQVPAGNMANIPPYKLAVTYSKTTSLVFPYAIKSVDRGSRDILVQKAPGVENILQVKAAKQGFPETNLTVVTADGHIYPYLVDYTDTPGSFSMSFGNGRQSSADMAVFNQEATNDIIASNSHKVIDRQRTIKHIKDHDYDISMDLIGLYIHNDMLYIQLRLSNHSAIDYDIQSLRFFIGDKKKAKRTAFQTVELSPVYLLGDTSLIRHSCTQNICVVLNKFTIPDKKYCELQLMEKNGGRHLSIRISNKRIIRAITI